MVIRNNDWYNLNSTRHYPLDDNATGDTDTTGSLPSNIIVDCRMRFPLLAGKFAYIGSINITENLVSVTFLAAQTVAAEKDTAAPNIISEFGPLAVVTVVNPTEYRPYPLEALYPGVGGWIIFGSGIKEPYHADFTTPEQSFLTPGAARWYRGLPVPSVQKEGVADTLTGLIRLKGSNSVSVTAPAAGRVINGVTRRAIVIAVKDGLGLLSLSDLVGPCGQRPESRTCDALPIEYINTVDPDCDGNIDIRFIGTLVTTYPYASLSSEALIPTAGLEIDFGLGITDACVTQECLPDDTGKLCNDYQDLCESISSQALSESSSSLSSSSSAGSLSLSSSSCGSLPYGTSFDDLTAQDFVVKSGTWAFKDLDSVSPIAESESAESQGWDAPIPSADIVYTPTHQSNRNTSIWDSCDYEALVGLSYVDIARERRTWTDIYIPADATAGLVFNYRNSPYTGNPHYLFAGIDTFHSQLLVGKFSGAGWSEVASSGTAALYHNTWYRIVGHSYVVNGQSTTLKVRVYEINHDLIHNWPDETLCTPVVSLSATTNTFGKISLGAQTTYSYTGKAGLFGWNESGATAPNIAYFSQFNFDKQVE
jgi:hypothetical protein